MYCGSVDECRRLNRENQQAKLDKLLGRIAKLTGHGDP